MEVLSTIISTKEHSLRELEMNVSKRNVSLLTSRDSLVSQMILFRLS